jgi:hypothetical protein
MNGRFNRVSLVTEIDAPRPPFDLRYFSNPAGFEPEMSRVLLHEATHYWQQLSQMYLLLVADEEWERLNRFRRGGQAAEPGPRLTALHKPDKVLRFSAHDLAESAGRYWDMMNIGPHNLVEAELAKGAELDDETRRMYEETVAAGMFRTSDDGYTQYTLMIAMRASAGAYARPFIYLQDKLGGSAMPLFPLLAQWSLQTPDPVPFFDKFAEYAGKRLEKWQRRDSWLRRLARRSFLSREMRELQLNLYATLAGDIARLAKKEGSVLWSGCQFLESTSLARHPVYAWAARWARVVGREAVKQGLANDMRAGFEKDPDSLALLAVDRLLALPGGSARDLLCTYLLPPVYRFSDDGTWTTGIEPSHDDNMAIAEACMEIHNWWEAFRSARRGY